MKRFSIILTLAAICACFSSCNKENKPESDNALIGTDNALIGTWDLETIVTEFLTDGEMRYYDDDGISFETVKYNKGDIITLTAVQDRQGITLTFRNDGLCTLVMTIYNKNGTVKEKLGHVLPYAYDEAAQTLEDYFYGVLGSNVTKLTESELHLETRTEGLIQTQRFKKVIGTL